MGSQIDRTERLNNNEIGTEYKIILEIKLSKLDIISNGKLKIKLKVLNLCDEDDGNAIDRIRHKKEERT